MFQLPILLFPCSPFTLLPIIKFIKLNPTAKKETIVQTELKKGTENAAASVL